MKNIVLVVLFLMTVSALYAQLPGHLEGKVKYPVLNQNPLMGHLRCLPLDEL